LQQITMYSAGITKSAKQPDAARALLQSLTAPSAKPIFKAKGLEPL
jgi:molybdate transport system substrate-binding protein